MSRCILTLSSVLGYNMSAGRISYGNIKVHAKDSLVTISFDCDFGPIAFSFSPEKLSAKLSMIVSETIDKIDRDDPHTLNAIARDTKLSIAEVRKNLEAYILKSNQTIPPSAIEKFMQGRNLTMEGSVQQIMENLPDGIVIMLAHLAFASLLTTTEVTNEANSKALLIDQGLYQLIYTKFKDSISLLWEKGYRNGE